MRFNSVITFLLLLVLMVSFCADVTGRTKLDYDGSKGTTGGSSAVGPPANCSAAHRVGQMVLGINNNGTFGGGFTVGSGQDCFTGEGVPSCEYPKGSNVEYLFAASFWIGAVVGRDTLVSFGADGWNTGREMYPDESPFGDMIKRSIIDPSKPEYEGAISEEDYIATYSDTYTQGIAPDVVSGRAHVPLNIKVTESSYAWSYDYAEDLVLFDYKIQNIGLRKIEKAYMGVYVDADVCYDCTGSNGFADDICGFVQTMEAKCNICPYLDTVNIAWIADNDGDPNALYPTPAVTATRIVRTPAENLDVSFNWWISNGATSLDFGPREQSEKGRWKEKFRDFGGYLGTPEGDANKYYILRNQEFDYDQIYTASILQSDTLWLYPDQGQAAAFSRGYDTRYLLSFGPFDINPGDVLPISFAYLAGDNLHHIQGNIANLPNDPDRYYANLDFTELGENARWASWIYDNPGIDTDSDGYFGETFVCNIDSIVVDSTSCTPNVDPGCTPQGWSYDYMTTDSFVCYTTGDNVPDFRGASPPPAPKKWVEPTQGVIRVRFNGFRSETTRDVFSDLIDFEGYRVYLGRDDRASSYALMCSYDIEDYNKWTWNPDAIGGAGFELTDSIYTAAELQCRYGSSCDDDDFDPMLYTRNNTFTPVGSPDSLIYFVPQDYNVSELGVATPIRKVYPNQPYPTVLAPELAPDSELTAEGELKYFEYVVEIPDLLPTVPYWVNVTAFDYGSPASGLPSLETSITVSSILAYPMPTSQEAQTENLPIYVYPNPYRVDGGYSDAGYEGLNVTTNSFEDRQRKIHFVNLPAECTISIFSIDGDLVRKIDHNLIESDPLASHEIWDLVTRNGQLVVSGLYYWTVEIPGKETQIGKLVIIL